MNINFSLIKYTVRAASNAAHREAKRHGRATKCPFVRGRGKVIATFNTKDGQCEPYPEAGCPEWNGTKRDIEQVVARVVSGYPDVEEIYIAGGYDMSELMDFDDYEPRVSEWSVTIWTKQDGYIVPRSNEDNAL